VQSMKLCRELHLPLFVILKPYPNAPIRHVRLGWVQSWDDENESFLIQFSDSEVEPEYIDTSALDDAEFQLRRIRTFRRAKVKVRPNQLKFRFEVLKRYGTACAVCEVAQRDLLQAAHLCPVEEGGCDDARNGLVFCLNHHRAYDKRLFKIDPSSFRIVGDDSYADLGITRSSIDHLRKLPHPDALAWAFGGGTPANLV
jgi:putative restriction endonuclease